MEWLNIHRGTIDSEAFVDASPAQRGTWLSLLSYCAGQENSGLIKGAKAFDERKWLKLAGVTLAEAQEDCGLWLWQKGDVLVQFYPLEKEGMVRRNRESASSGGKAKANATSRQTFLPPATAGATAGANPSAIPGAPAEGKGREGKGMEGKGSARAEESSAHIPSETEFMDAFMATGIPEDYLRRQFTSFQGKKLWIAQGALVDWQWIVRRRWSDDAATYSPRGAEAGEGLEKKPRGQSTAQQLFEIDRELAEVKLRLDQAYELNQPPDEADVARERDLKKRRAELKAGGAA